MEASLLQIRDSWNMANQEFEESGQCFIICIYLFIFAILNDPLTDCK